VADLPFVVPLFCLRNLLLSNVSQVFEVIQGLCVQRPCLRCSQFLLFRDTHSPYNAPYEYYSRLTRHSTPFELQSDEENVDLAYRRWRWQIYRKARDQPDELSVTELEQLRDAYDASVSFMDHCIGLFIDKLKELDIYDNSAIVLSADHGEEFFEHGVIGHGEHLYDTLVHTPLIMKIPGIKPRRITSQVRNIDIMPTLAEVVGQKIDTSLLQGRSLFPVIRGKDKTSRPAISSDSLHGNSLRYEGYKLIATSTKNSLFDLKTDPRESNNLWFNQLILRGNMRAKLLEMRYAEWPLAQKLGATETWSLDTQTLDHLKDLGYIR